MESRPIEGVAQFAQEVVGKGHTFEGRARFQFAMQVGRDVANLNHGGHAMSIVACETHVNGPEEIAWHSECEESKRQKRNSTQRAQRKRHGEVAKGW